MNKSRNKYYILNYAFISCVILLVLNDHLLKLEYSNWITGKLSDVVGIIIFPLFLSFLFPKLQTKSIWITLLLFTFWKSPYSESFINLYNSISPIGITRVVDFTDLIAFLALPIPYYLIKRVDRFRFLKVEIKYLNPAIVLFPTVFAMMATAPPKNHYDYSNGNLRCYKCAISVRETEETILKKLDENNIQVEEIQKNDSSDIHRDYVIKSLIIDNDTLKDVNFSIHKISDKKSKIYFNGLRGSKVISQRKLFGSLRIYYKKQVLRKLKATLKKTK